ncbi:uncharacterized protein LOC135107144 [Scylla paramamosain]|uniref:uncharacterized protein LOC135107144 n=1 Tax=Scylla paramamosain TaxID=85552 RepID=UPI003083776E
MLVEGNEADMANIPEVCDGHTLSQDGLTPLHAAALCGAPSAAVEALLRRDVSPHVTTPDNMTPADLARQQGQDSVIKGLQRHHCVQSCLPPDDSCHHACASPHLRLAAAAAAAAAVDAAAGRSCCCPASRPPPQHHSRQHTPLPVLQGPSGRPDSRQCQARRRPGCWPGLWSREEWRPLQTVPTSQKEPFLQALTNVMPSLSLVGRVKSQTLQ